MLVSLLRRRAAARERARKRKRARARARARAKASAKVARTRARARKRTCVTPAPPVQGFWRGSRIRGVRAHCRLASCLRRGGTLAQERASVTLAPSVPNIRRECRSRAAGARRRVARRLDLRAGPAGTASSGDCSLLPPGGSPQPSRQPRASRLRRPGGSPGVKTPAIRGAMTPNHARRDSCGT